MYVFACAMQFQQLMIIFFYPCISDSKTGIKIKPKNGKTLVWKDLYFPIGCGMVKGGIIPNVPVVQRPDGTFAVIIYILRFHSSINVFLMLRYLI